MYVYVCICMYMYVYVYVCICMYMYVYVCICMYMYVYVCICTYNTTRKHSLINKYNKKYRYTYLDLPYGTYFCRCSKTLELLSFLPKNAVPEKKCRCEKLSEHVVGYFRHLVGHFRRRKTGLASIYQKKFWSAQRGRSYAKPIYWAKGRN